MNAPVEAISSAGSARSPAMQLPEVQALDLAQFANANANGAAAPGNAFATLAKPAPPPSHAAGVEMSALSATVSDAVQHGVVKPHVKELQGLLENAAATGQAVPTEELMLVSMKIQEGSAVTSFLTQAVNSTRQSLQTLIEKS